MKGRRPKDEAVKALAGFPGKRRRKPAEPEPAQPDDAFAAPRRLTRSAHAVWQRTITVMREVNLVRPSDLECLAVYCETAARYERAIATLDRQGETYEVKSNHGTYQRKRPEVEIAGQCAREMRQFLESLGMTTGSRIRAQAQLASNRQLPLPFPEAPASPSAPADSPVGYMN